MNVLILSTTTGYQIRSFGEAAAARGIRLTFASDRCDQLDDPWWDQAIAVRFHDVAGSADAVVAAARERPVNGVLAVGDRPTVLAARIAEQLGLPGNPPAAAATTRSKLAMREVLARAGLLTPGFVPVADSGEVETIAPGLRFPVVVKPLGLSGSRGVIRADDAGQLRVAARRIWTLLEAPDVRAQRELLHARLLIEQFIPGQEFAIEGVLTQGVFRPLAIFDKPDPLDGPYFEETIYVTPSRARAETQRAIEDAVARACVAIGLRHGPVHAECRVNDEGVWVLEVAARPIGGLCSRALRFAGRAAGARQADGGRPSHASLEELLLRHAVGEDVSGLEREADASAVMMIPIPRRGIYKGVDGVHEARQVDGVDDIRITAKEDALLVPLPEGNSYLGFIFARGETAADAERALREAHARLRFQIDRELSVI